MRVTFDNADNNKGLTLVLVTRAARLARDVQADAIPIYVESRTQFSLDTLEYFILTLWTFEGPPA